jgi:hypothetical protein
MTRHSQAGHCPSAAASTTVCWVTLISQFTSRLGWRSTSSSHTRYLENSASWIEHHDSSILESAIKRYGRDGTQSARIVTLSLDAIAMYLQLWSKVAWGTHQEQPTCTVLSDVDRHGYVMHQSHQVGFLHLSELHRLPSGSREPL